MAEMIVPIAKIKKIEEHPNADRLEIAFIDVFDWPIIIGKGNFKVGETCVYFPVDLVCGEKLEGVLLGDSKVKLTKGRIRAARIRKFVSYGILAPLDIIAKEYPKTLNADYGDDLLKLGVLDAHKFEPPVKPVNLNGNKQNPPKKKKGNQSFTKYMDMSHLQQKPGVFKDDDIVVATEKMHGTSFRAGNLKRDFTFFEKIIVKVKGWFGITTSEYELCYGSRNVQRQNVKVDGSVYKLVFDKYNLKYKLTKNMELFGEIIGPGIQTGYTYGIKQDNYVLLMYDMKIDGKYVDYGVLSNFCRISDLQMVPYIECNLWGSIKDKDYNEGKSLFDPKTKVREGCVYGTFIERINAHGRGKCKHLNPKYLLNKDNSDNH